MCFCKYDRSRGKHGIAPAHSMVKGDVMGKKTKPYRIEFVQVGDRSDEVVKSFVEKEIKKVLAKNGLVSYNLNEVLDKYISGEMRSEYKRRQGICQGINNEGFPEGQSGASRGVHT